MKFIKIVSVTREYYQRFGDPKNGNKPHYWREYGNIKDPKNGTRPYFLLKDENSILWVIPSTSKISIRKMSLILQHPEWYIKYYSFSSGVKKLTIFEIIDMSPITEKYLCDYKISYKDNKSYLEIDTMKEKPNNYLLRQIINTNYFVENGIGLQKWEIKKNSIEWNEFINQLENNSEAWQKQIKDKFIIVKTKKIIKELEIDL